MMKWTGAACISLLLVTCIFFSRCGSDNTNGIDTVANPVAKAVQQIRLADDYFNRKVQLKTEVFYRAKGYQRAWLNKRKPDKMFFALVDEIKESSRYGFEPDDYGIEKLVREVETLYDSESKSQSDIDQLDIKISATFFLFTTHLIEGRVRYPGAREFLWKRGMPLENDIALLVQMESGKDLRKQLDQLHPDDPQYARLQSTLKDYRELIPADTFPDLPQRMRIKPGERHKAIPLVRKKLSLSDFKGETSDTSTVYDEKLQKAVLQFQERHGLERNGLIEGETIRFLNVSVERKAELIALNLERLRWRPHVTGEGDEILINVPEYMLRVNRNGRNQLEMRVVLGAEYTPTPVFTDTLKYLVFSPTWAVPRSIFENEFLPKLREDPAHFDTKRFAFYKRGKTIDPFEEDWSDDELDTSDYSVLENPGDQNSLGKVKFIMPNDFSVYLHDTPADKLFNLEERALSHGCIRLERPEELAHYLLSNKKGWNKNKIKEAMAGGEPVQVDLEKPCPVYILYRTAWVDDNSLVHFREDIYGHDQRQLARLED